MNKDDRVFAFSEDSFREHLRAVIESDLKLSWETFSITPHALRRGGATKDFRDHRLPLEQIKSRGRWKRFETMYEYVRLGDVTLLQVKIPDRVMALTKTIDDEVGKYFCVPDVRSRWETSSTVSEVASLEFPVLPVSITL